MGPSLSVEHKHAKNPLYYERECLGEYFVLRECLITSPTEGHKIYNAVVASGQTSISCGKLGWEGASVISIEANHLQMKQHILSAFRSITLLDSGGVVLWS